MTTRLAWRPETADKMTGPGHCLTHGSATSPELDKQDGSKNSNCNTPTVKTSGVELKEGDDGGVARSVFRRNAVYSGRRLPGRATAGKCYV